MKRFGCLVYLGSSLVLSVANPAASSAEPDCSTAMVSGRYSARNGGTIFDDRLLTGGVTVVNFDGVGGWRMENPTFISQGRGVAPPGEMAGTYYINADCSGALNYEVGDLVFQIVVNDSGNEMEGLAIPGKTRPNRVVFWTFKKQVKVRHEN